MIFGAIGTVLSDMNEAGFEEHGKDWEEALEDKLGTLETSYRNLRDVDRDLIDYSGLDAQTAYLFRYVAGHAEFICEILTRVYNSLGQPLFKSDVINVTSIGGGPGSELLGLLKYLDSAGTRESVTRIVYRIFDKERHWEHLVQALSDSVDSNIEIVLVFQELNIVDSQACQGLDLSQEDLTIMSFFVSEVCELPEKTDVIRNFKSILETVSPDSALLYNDSNAYSFYSFINQRTRDAKRFEQLVEVEEKMEIKAPALDGIYQEFIDRYDFRPKLSGKLIAKYYRRT